MKLLKKIILNYKIKSVKADRAFCARLYFGEENGSSSQQSCLKMYQKYDAKVKALEKKKHEMGTAAIITDWTEKTFNVFETLKEVGRKYVRDFRCSFCSIRVENIIFYKGMGGAFKKALKAEKDLTKEEKEFTYKKITEYYDFPLSER